MSRQSVDKTGILSPPIQFIAPSPTASASPSPRLLQNSSPLSSSSAHQQQPQQVFHQIHHHQPQQQQRYLSDVVLLTNSEPLSGRRLSTSSVHSQSTLPNSSPNAAAAAGGTILFRPSPTQSPAAGNIIFATSSTPSQSPVHGQTIVGNEFNTTLVGSNNISLNVKKNGGGAGQTFTAATTTGGFMVTSGGKKANNGGQQIIGQTIIPMQGHHHGAVSIGAVSPKTTAKKAMAFATSPINSPIASPTLKPPTPQPQLQQIPVMAGPHQMLQIIQAPHLLQQQQQVGGATLGTMQQQQRQQTTTMSFQAPIATAQQVQQQQQHHSKNKTPQQILPKPSGGGASPSSSKAKTNVSAPTVTPIQQQQPQQQQIVTSQNTILTSATTSQPSSIILPTAQPLLMSTNQMPVLVQQQTAQGVQFILRQPATSQLTAAPLVIHHPNSRPATIPQAQPQQLLRIVNAANGQMQLAPTFIVSSQGNLIQQTQTPPSTNQQNQQQHHHQATVVAKAATDQKINQMQLGQLTTGNLVQMPSGQFLSHQFPTNFGGLLPQNVTFASPTSTPDGTTTIQFAGTNVIVPQQQQQQQQQNQAQSQPIQTIQHQIISPISSPAQTIQQQHHLMAPVDESQKVICNGETTTTTTQPMIVLQQNEVQQVKSVNKKVEKKDKAPKKPKKEKAKPVKLKDNKKPAEQTSTGKLDLANVMKLCGIGMEDDDDDLMMDTTMNMSQDFGTEQQTPLEPTPMEVDQGQSGVNTTETPETASQDIMITIPGMSNDQIPFSFTIPTTTSGAIPTAGVDNNKEKPDPKSVFISIDGNNQSSGQNFTISLNPSSVESNTTTTISKISDSMCVPTFVNSVLNSHVTPTLQSQINEIQNQLMGVSSTTSNLQQPPTAPIIASSVNSVNNSNVNFTVKTIATTTTTTSASKVTSNSRKKGGANPNKSTIASRVGNLPGTGSSSVSIPVSSINQQVNNSLNKPVVNQIKAIPTACGLVPSQIGNIQISQVDSTKTSPPNKAVSIENQIQITPILDTTAPTPVAATTTVTSSVPAPVATSSMTVTMKMVPVTSTPMTTGMGPAQVVVNNQVLDAQQMGNIQIPGMQLNLQHQSQILGQPITIPQPPPQSQTHQHPLMSQLTGSLSLSLVEDGRLVLKHDANQPQDAQSQVILQTILSGVLGNVTLINEPSKVVEKPKINKIAPTIQTQSSTTAICDKSKMVLDSAPPPQQQQQVLNQNMPKFVELPKIGPNQQLFSMNTITNQITQINPGLTTASLGPMERLLIVPAGINAQQLAQCLLQGQIHFNNVGQVGPTQSEAPQQPESVQPNPQGVPVGQNQQTGQVIYSNHKKVEKSEMSVSVKSVLPNIQAAKPPAKKAKAKKAKPTVDTKVKPISKVLNHIPPPHVEILNTTTIQKVGTEMVMNKNLPVQQVMPLVNTVQNQPILPSSKAPLPMKNNMVISKIKPENTAIVRPSIISMSSSAGSNNKITITTTMITTPNASPATSSNQLNQLPTTPTKVQQSLASPLMSTSAQSQQVMPRVQTIQLTPQKQQLLKEVQSKIQLASAKLKDKNLLATLTIPLDLEENNTQPLPSLHNLANMTDPEIHLVLQRLFIEQQRILATGKVIPTIPNHSFSQIPQVGPNSTIQAVQPNQQSPSSAALKIQPLLGNSQIKPPKVIQLPNKVQLTPTTQIVMGPSTMVTPTTTTTSSTTTATTAIVKNLQLMQRNQLLRPQQFNEMTIKPIISVTSATTTPIPNKVINSTTIIPAPVGLATSTGQGNNVGIGAPSSKITTESGISIIPMITPTVQQKEIPRIDATGMSNQQNASSISVAQKMESAAEAQNLLQKKMLKCSMFDRQLKVDQDGSVKPDTDTPFSSREDAVKRLIRYHCNYKEFEDENPEEDFRFADTASRFGDTFKNMLNKYQFLLMKESQRHYPLSEVMMLENLVVAEVQKEIVEIKKATEELKNFETEVKPTVEAIKEEKMTTEEVKVKQEDETKIVKGNHYNNGVVNGNVEPDDETTRTSSATDSNLNDVKSEPSNFPWNDLEEDEETNVGGDLNKTTTVHEKAGQKNNDTGKGGKNSISMNASNFRGENFDIESEILPNFILNKKVTTEEQKSQAKDLLKELEVDVQSKQQASKEVPKNENCYDEWLCIQKELANMDSTENNDGKHDNKQFVDMLESPSSMEKQFNDLLGGGSGTFEKNHSTRFDSIVSFDKDKNGQKGKMTTEEDHKTDVKKWPNYTENNNQQQLQPPQEMYGKKDGFFGMESSIGQGQNSHEQWIDFHQPQNSFDFPIHNSANNNNGGSNGTKRPWNGGEESNNSSNLNGMISTSTNDDFYNKKMCYNGNEFDFNQFIMSSGAGNLNNSNMASSMPNMDLDNSQNFDDDINRQVQNAIDSILNLQFSLDPTMGTLLVDNNNFGVNSAGGSAQGKKKDLSDCILDGNQMLTPNQSFNQLIENGPSSGMTENNSPTNSTSSQSQLSSISTMSNSSNSVRNTDSMVPGLPFNQMPSMQMLQGNSHHHQLHSSGNAEEDALKSVLTS